MNIIQKHIMVRQHCQVLKDDFFSSNEGLVDKIGEFFDLKANVTNKIFSTTQLDKSLKNQKILAKLKNSKNDLLTIDNSIILPKAFSGKLTDAIKYLYECNVVDSNELYVKLTTFNKRISAYIKASKDQIPLQDLMKCVQTNLGNMMSQSQITRLKEFVQYINDYFKTFYNLTTSTSLRTLQNEFRTEQELGESLSQLAQLVQEYQKTIGPFRKTYKLYTTSLDEFISTSENKSSNVPDQFLKYMFSIVEVIADMTEAYGKYVHEIQVMEECMIKIFEKSLIK